MAAPSCCFRATAEHTVPPWGAHGGTPLQARAIRNYFQELRYFHSIARIIGMNKSTHPSRLPVSQRFYALMLRAYPTEFRREYGPHMAQLFRDSGQAAESRKGPTALLYFWLTVLIDLLKTAPKEHLDNLRKEESVMNNLRRDALALFGCIAIIVVALVLLNYGRTHHVSGILLLGYALDAMVVMGVVGNFIVFLLVNNQRVAREGGQ